MKEYWKQHWFEYVLSAFLGTFFAVIISFCFGYCFSTNDDAMLRSIVSGSYTETPQAHLIYIMYPLGLIGKCLYQILPSVPWYDFFMTGLHYVSWILLMGRVGEQFDNRKNKSIAVILTGMILLTIDFPNMIMHQYTILAAQPVATALFFLLTSKTEDAVVYYSERILAIVLFLTGFLLRKQVFLLALPLLLPVFFVELTKLGKQIKEKRTALKRIVFITVLVFTVVTFWGVDKLAYSSAQWKAFQTYNDARTDIYDYYGIPKYENHKDIYDALEFDYGDYLAIDRYNSELTEDMTVDKLATIAETAGQSWQSAYSIPSIIRIMAEAVLSQLLNSPLQPIGTAMIILYGLSVFICLYNRKYKNLLPIGFLLLFQTAVIAYFTWRTRFPERVSFGLYFMTAVCLAGMLLGSIKDNMQADREKNKVLIKVVVAGIFVFCIAYCVTGIGPVLKENKAIRDNYKDWVYVNEYFESHQENKYFIDTKSFVFSTELMFKPDAEAENIFRLGTWVQSSPLQKDFHESRGVYQSLSEAIREEGSFYVQDSKQDPDWIRRFCEGKDWNCDIEITDTINTPGGRSFDVIKLKAAKTSD